MSDFSKIVTSRRKSYFFLNKKIFFLQFKVFIFFQHLSESPVLLKIDKNHLMKTKILFPLGSLSICQKYHLQHIIRFKKNELYLFCQESHGPMPLSCHFHCIIPKCSLSRRNSSSKVCSFMRKEFNEKSIGPFLVMVFQNSASVL